MASGRPRVKITSVETIPVRVPIKPELAIKSGRGGTHDTSPFLLVKVHTDAGLVGLGEASCTPRWSGEDQVSAAHFINTYFAPALVGQDPTRIDELTQSVFPLVAGNYFTKAAVEMALWDLAGKAAGKPVYELLGVAFAEQPVWAGDPEEMAAVRRATGVPIIADESLYTLADAQQLVRAAACDVFSIYVGKAGGIGPATAIADFALSRGIACTIGSNLELG